MSDPPSGSAVGAPPGTGAAAAGAPGRRQDDAGDDHGRPHPAVLVEHPGHVGRVGERGPVLQGEEQTGRPVAGGGHRPQHRARHVLVEERLAPAAASEASALSR